MPRPRRTVSRQYRKTIYAVLEGEKTEVQYIKFLESLLPGRHGLRILSASPGSARSTLFNKAKAIIQESDEDTEVWILCDVDDQADKLVKLNQTRFKGSERLRWAISNPEFAVWLVMHFQECTQWQQRNVYADLARKHGVASGKHGKDINKTKLVGTSSTAIKNAASARNQHVTAGHKLPHNNPQSDVDQFVQRIVSLYNECLPPGRTPLDSKSLY